jgi:hypothetical protein
MKAFDKNNGIDYDPGFETSLNETDPLVEAEAAAAHREAKYFASSERGT